MWGGAKYNSTGLAGVGIGTAGAGGVDYDIYALA